MAAKQLVIGILFIIASLPVQAVNEKCTHILDPDAQLWMSVNNDYEVLAKQALDCGANPNMISRSTTTIKDRTYSFLESALICAARKGHENIVKLLIEHKVDVNAPQKLDINGEREDGMNALMTASNRGHINIMHLLLENGADVHALRKDGTDVLITTLWSKEDRWSEIKLLLEYGATANYHHYRSTGLESPLSWAIEYGDLETILLLVQHGAKFPQTDICRSDMYPRDKLCKTSEFFIDVVKKQYVTILKLLKHYQFNFNSWTAKQWANSAGKEIADLVDEIEFKHKIRADLEALKKSVSPQNLLQALNDIKKSSQG
jgi:ankyrin repeat protein